MKPFFKQCAAWLLFLTGVTPFLFFLQLRKRNHILVLLYHRIRTPRSRYDASVTARHFEQQLKWMKRFFQVIPASQIPERLRQNNFSSQPLAAVTFDDGYRDNKENAWPLLKKYQIPATIFLAAGSLDNGEPLWTSRVEALLQEAPVREISLNSLPQYASLELGSGQDRTRVCYEIKSEMKKLANSDRVKVLAELEEKIGRSVPQNHEIHSEMLSWQDVREMQAEFLADFGSHTMSHSMLTRLTPEAVEWELEESKKTIERETGKPAGLLSYPGNDYNSEIEAIARKTGYEAAFAVDQKWIALDSGNLFRLQRVHIEDGSLPLFLAEITLVFSSMRSLLKRRKGAK